MRFSCLRENLTTALALTSGVTGKNIQLPILGNVLISADSQKLELSATNLETAVRVSVRAKIEGPGAFTVPARTMADFVNLCTNERLDVELVGSELAVKSGKTTTKIKGMAADEFPVIPAVETGKGYVLKAKDFKEGLQNVLPAAAKNDIRPELAGICFGFNVNKAGGLVLAATDSYRLAERKLVLEQGEEESRVIVPARTAQEIQRVLSLGGENEPTARLLVSDHQLVVSYDSVQVISRLVDGQYPEYTQIIPQTFFSTALVSISTLTKEIKAAGLFSVVGVNAVTLQFVPTTGMIVLTSTAAQTGEYRAEVSAEISGTENSLLLNYHYLLDGLNQLPGDEVVFNIVNHESPCVLTTPDKGNFTYIVMPVRQ